MKIILSCLLFIIFIKNGIFAQDPFSYLQNYGYIRISENNEFSLTSSNEYRRALLEMQRFAHLPLTGELDNATINKMLQPRCGLPDVQPNTTINEHKRIKRFVTYGSKWLKNLITWSLVRESSKVPSDIVIVELRKAFQVWSEGSEGRLKFQELENNNKADIKIGFFVGDHGCGKKQAFDGPSMRLAHAFAPPKGDIHFDDDEDWNSNKNQGVSIFWTAVHEIGHSLGFAHTADSQSIMFPYYQYHEGHFKLSESDRSGIRYLYENNKVLSNESPEPQLPIVPKSKNKTFNNDEEPKLRSKEPCNTNIDAIASIRGDIFVFKDNHFWWIKSTLDLIRLEPSPISSYFIGFPEHVKKIDAVYERRTDQKIVFFVGEYYYVFSANTLHFGPRPISDFGLKDLFGNPIEQIDTVFNYGHNGRTFIIARDIYGQSLYWRLNEDENHVEYTYPNRVSTFWVGIPTPVDGAFTWSYDSQTYFFKGIEYWKFDSDKSQANRHYPKLIQDFWFRQISCPSVSFLKSFTNGPEFSDKRMNTIFVIFIIFYQFFIQFFKY